MNPVIRAILIYAFLLVIFRISGKRTLAQATIFDFALLLMIGEAAQQSLLGEDFSIINTFILAATLVAIDFLLTLGKIKYKLLGWIVESVPLLLIDKGKLLKDRMRKARVMEEDILEAARELHGLERLDQIKYAILETDGKISIIPQEKST